MNCQERWGKASGITGYVLKAKKKGENVMVMERMGGRLTGGTVGGGNENRLEGESERRGGFGASVGAKKIVWK